MKILAFHNRYRQPGGELRVFEEEACLLEEHGHVVERMIVSNNDLKAWNPVTAVAVVWNRSICKQVEARIASFGPDIVHVHNDFPLASPAVYYAAKRAGARVVHTLHNYRNICVNGLLNRAGKPCRECLDCGNPLPGMKHGCYRGSRLATGVAAARLVVHRAMDTWGRQIDVFIAPTEFVRDRHVEAGFPAEKIVVKPHFVTGEPRIGSGRGNYALFVGRLMPDKGIDVLLEAWRQVPAEYKLKIVGDGPMADLVKQAIIDMPNIEWLGPRAPEDVHALLEQAGCAVVPSPVYESFGRVVVEAMSHGTPVVATGHGAMAELIEDGVTGRLVSPNDPGNLAHAVWTMLSEQRADSGIRERCRQAYEAHWSQEKNHEQLISVYRHNAKRSVVALPLAA